jgi:hypothetical protein
MSLTELSAKELLSIITHVKQWVGNLRRARQQRKQESKQALRAVISAVRETTVYMRSLKEGGKKSIDKEERLSLKWTRLAFELEDLGLNKLAARCSIKGRYWANPADFDQGFLERAGMRLSDIETLAQMSLHELEK